MLDIICCVQIHSGTMSLTIAPPWVQRRWSLKRRREGENEGRRKRRRVEENFYLYLACLLVSFILVLFVLTPKWKAWQMLWSLFSVSLFLLLCFSFFLLSLSFSSLSLSLLRHGHAIKVWEPPLFSQGINTLSGTFLFGRVDSLLSLMNTFWDVFFSLYYLCHSVTT